MQLRCPLRRGRNSSTVKQGEFVQHSVSTCQRQTVSYRVQFSSNMHRRGRAYLYNFICRNMQELNKVMAGDARPGRGLSVLHSNW